jgi:hypothetical protein
MSIKEMYEAIRAGTVTLDEFVEWVYDREYTALNTYLDDVDFTETD